MQMIPRNFVERYWKDVSNPISLRLPNESECKMFWVQRGDDIWLMNWKNFARSLRCGDLLVFQYNGGSDFHIIILDDSKLEIDYSSMKCNGEENSNQVCKQEESDDDDCVEIPNDIVTPAATPQRTNIDKRKINMNSTQQKVSGKFIYVIRFIYLFVAKICF
ncbi:putative DNA-binding pseudobarrel domain-containing protein [Medicago truncatula]|uniref:Putative DNA-binding pseudobarrel domain-containing protein n=1 Tax=Medicago truncatula TaxID=3880 RepID=A0A396JPE8_MEDTR|nr:putative DNA-binding pseudobarrel domain-containing protein [Medicago truncatula]